MAMENSHVVLVSAELKADGFQKYPCDWPIPLGVNLGSLTTVLKCAKDDDRCTLKAADEGDILTLTYQAKNADRIAVYEMKLMDIDADTLPVGIPDTEYDTSVTMPASEFARIVRDLLLLGESVRIEVSKEGIRFVADGEATNGNILLKQSAEAAKKKKGSISKRKGGDDEDEDAAEPEDEEGAESDGEVSDGEGRKKKIKKERVKKEEKDGEDFEMDTEVLEHKLHTVGPRPRTCAAAGHLWLYRGWPAAAQLRGRGHLPAVPKCLFGKPHTKP
ncbi:proliferating cell nuclear antigen, N-terminal domain-containing protein [Lenzites betulinus]|nr:proliferating cell nuclear antigen, N-terminal domain-containing protein [Lenzites betulinus]